ncbi:MAG TPA: hypothetical protein VD813_13370 [Pseudonocardia sp.]|nr:hypothetical protein [Pseudonocardia sp.]
MGEEVRTDRTGERRPGERRQAVAPPGLHTARVLSAIIVVLMVAASAAGLWVDGLYQDDAPVAAMFRGYDLVTLVIAAPLLALTLLPALRGSVRAQLLWAGMLAYAAYDYALYVFGTAFNDVLLLHVALFSLSVFAFGLALANLDAAGIAARFAPRTPVRTISVVLLVVGLALGGIWVFQALRFAVSGEAPTETLLVLPPANTHLAYVLDLALLVPGYVLAAVLLWRRAPWGYVLAGVLLPFSVVYQLNYMTALAFQADAGVSATAFDVQEVPIVAALAAATVLLFTGVRPASPVPG